MLQQISEWLAKTPDLGRFLFILVLTFIVEQLASRTLDRLMKSRFADTNDEITRLKFLKNAQTGIIYIVGFIMAAREVKMLQGVASSLLAGAGLAAVAVGFASQQVLSNIISGIFIIIFRPFRVNDRVRIQDKYVGTVEDITLRHTILRDSENRRIVVPNAVINNEILVNSDFIEDKICKHIEFNIDFSSDLELAKKIMQNVAIQNPNLLDGRDEKERAENRPVADVRVVRLSETGVVLRLWAWAKDNSTGSDLQYDLFESIKKEFDKNGIKLAIPFLPHTLGSPVK